MNKAEFKNMYIWVMVNVLVRVTIYCTIYSKPDFTRVRRYFDWTNDLKIF